jgi:hypothetical protein
MFDSSPWIDRLRDDEALTDNLDDAQAERLLAWGEKELAASTSDGDADRVLAAMRDVNRRAGEGEAPEELIAGLERRERDTAATGEPAAAETPATAGGSATAETPPSAKPETPAPGGEPRDDDEPRSADKAEGRAPARETAAGAPSTENNQRPSSTP